MMFSSLPKQAYVKIKKIFPEKSNSSDINYLMDVNGCKAIGLFNPTRPGPQLAP